jgi:long-chain acyl-CoA synthetase
MAVREISREFSSVAADELTLFCAHYLAAYKRPREVRFVNRIPTTSTGKIMRRALLEGCT